MSRPLSLDRIRTPNVALTVFQRLAKTLIRDKPKISNEGIDLSLAKLEAQVQITDVALVERFREVNPQLIAGEIEFDRGGDINWIWLRKLLEGWRDAWAHPGLDVLPPALQAKVNLPAMRARAEQARKLHDRLFGAGGTNWVMSSFIEQSQTMATILNVIQADGLREELAAVVGPEQVLLLETIQIHYEDMVSARMSRENRPTDNFNDLRASLRWRIDHYKGAVEVLRDPDEPASFLVVERALRSLILLSQRIASGATTQEIDELVDGELVELDLSGEPGDDADQPALLGE